MSELKRVKFVYESGTGVEYMISIDGDTGAGEAIVLTKGRPIGSATRTAVTVDPASLAAWLDYHNTRKAHAAVYNTAQLLSAILT